MTQQTALICAVLLAGLAAAGLVNGPPARLRRLTTSDRAGSRGRGVPLVPRPRPDAIAPAQRVAAGVTAGAVTLLAWRALDAGPASVGWLLAPIVAVGLIVALGRVESEPAKRRRLQMIDDLPHLLELLAAGMRAGLPLRGAVREVVTVADGPLAEDLGGLLQNIDLGRHDADAWRDLRDHPALGRVSVDLARSVESGVMVADTLRRHARIARRDRRGALEARAKTVGVKTVPALMLCLVPSFLLIAIVPSAVTAFQGILS